MNKSYRDYCIEAGIDIDEERRISMRLRKRDRLKKADNWHWNNREKKPNK